MKGNIIIDTVVGKGAALNVPVGFVPDFVTLYNMTDGDIVSNACLNWVVPFSSGGTTEIKPGAVITGATSKARAVVQSVLLMSGSWAGGDAAGFFTLQEGSLKGTFGSENVFISNDDVAGSDDATVTANVTYNVAFAAAASSATGTSAISRFEGNATTPKGFTIGSVIAEANKALTYIAYRADR